MSVLNNTKTCAPKHRSIPVALYPVSPTALSATNEAKIGLNNDIQMEKVLNYFPEISKKLLSDYDKIK
jgi:hypothetical protein